ncbi:MAG TPA: Calx-beta domain-containing protein [Acetobacteraceae bacterium]|nr:Calx-beta domain-containing protein [Acetobacteraceae bacterium]
MPITIQATGTKVAEGNSGGVLLNFVVELSAAAPSPVTVDFRTVSGTALEDVDFGARTGTLTFQPGVTSQTVSVDVVGDTLDETDENFSLELSNPNGALLADQAPVLAATGVILDDDGIGSNLGLFVSDPILVEGNSGTTTAQFEITLSRPSASTISLPFHTADGSATAGSDYAATSGTLSFAPGQTTATVNVPVFGDTAVEASENFSLVVTPDAAIANGTSDSTGVALILDDDAGGTKLPTVSIRGGEVAEGNSGGRLLNFVVELSAAAPSPVTVDFRTVSGTALEDVDFVARTGTLTFQPGVTSQTVSVDVVGDTLVEGNETFTPKSATRTAPRLPAMPRR